ncbi:hypothetical protein HY065_01465 [Candidatus Berkelbacteria bacterium]|nr:hypothetical protein [Candidatus Berkelbacteria bacterium]
MQLLYKRIALAVAVVLTGAAIAMAQTATSAQPTAADTPTLTEDQLGAEVDKAVASLPACHFTNILPIKRFFLEAPREFFNPGKYVPLDAKKRLAEYNCLKAKNDDKGAKRMLEAHLQMLDKMEGLARTKKDLEAPFNQALGDLALAYKKLEHEQNEDATQLVQAIKDEHLKVAAVVNDKVTPPSQVLDALTRANVIKPEQASDLKTMEAVVNALRAKQQNVSKVNRETLTAMMQAALARKYLQKTADSYVADRMASLTAEATMLKSAIAADQQDAYNAMVANMMQLASEQGYTNGFGTDPFSQQIKETIEKYRKGQKVDIDRLLDTQFKDTIAARLKAVKSGDVTNPDYADRYVGIAKFYSDQANINIPGFNQEQFRKVAQNTFGYNADSFRNYEENQRKMRDASEVCYRQGKIPTVKSYENAEIDCRDRSYVAGPSPEQYRAKQEECAKQGKSVRWLGGDRLECEGSSYTAVGTPAPNPCPQGQSAYMKQGAYRMYDDAARTFIPGTYECRNPSSPGGSYTYSQTYSPSPGSCPPPGAPASDDYGINPSTGQCEPHMGGHTYSGSYTYTYTNPSTNTYGSPTTSCGSGKYWVQRSGNWGCENYYNANNAQECPPGYYWASGVQPSCWPSSFTYPYSATPSYSYSSSPSPSPTSSYSPAPHTISSGPVYCATEPSYGWQPDTQYYYSIYGPPICPSTDAGQPRRYITCMTKWQIEHTGGQDPAGCPDPPQK